MGPCSDPAHLSRVRILYSNYRQLGFFNQFGEFSSLAKFVSDPKKLPAPFGSAARYVPHYLITSEVAGVLSLVIYLIYRCQMF